MLEKNLNELEERYSTCKENVSKLEFKLSDYESICDKSKINTSSQLISSKIIELSKKLREKTSEVESLKTKYSKLEKQAYQLKNQLENDPQKYSIVGMLYILNNFYDTTEISCTYIGTNQRSRSFLIFIQILSYSPMFYIPMHDFFKINRSYNS